VVMRWPEARFEPACARAYAPFRYTLKGSMPGATISCGSSWAWTG